MCMGNRESKGKAVTVILWDTLVLYHFTTAIIPKVQTHHCIMCDKGWVSLTQKELSFSVGMGAVSQQWNQTATVKARGPALNPLHLTSSYFIQLQGQCIEMNTF